MNIVCIYNLFHTSPSVSSQWHSAADGQSQNDFVVGGELLMKYLFYYN